MGEESQTIDSQMVNLRTPLVLLLCASVGVHAGVSLEDLVTMVPQGGLVNTWLYETAPKSGVLCINTTNAHRHQLQPQRHQLQTDPCTDTIEMPDRLDGGGKEKFMSFGLKKADKIYHAGISIDNINSYNLTVTPEPGSSGIMASNSRAADLLNPDKDPMKAHICTSPNRSRYSTLCEGKLDGSSGVAGYRVYATIRKEKASLMNFSLISNDVLMTYQGKLSVVKISMCYGVLYQFTHDPICPPISQLQDYKCKTDDKGREKEGWAEKCGPDSKCNHARPPSVPQGSTCASKKTFVLQECYLERKENLGEPKHGDLGEKTGGRRRRRTKKTKKTKEPTKEPTKAPTNWIGFRKPCPPLILDALQNAAAQRV